MARPPLTPESVRYQNTADGNVQRQKHWRVPIHVCLMCPVFKVIFQKLSKGAIIISSLGFQELTFDPGVNRKDRPGCAVQKKSD